MQLGKLIGGSLPWVAMSVLAGVLLLVALLTTWWAVRELVGPRLDYRYMTFDQNGDKLIKDLDMGGVALGVNFVF